MKFTKYVVPFCMLLLLSACSGDSTEQKLSNILSDIYDSEADYREVQAELAEIEIKEQANFQSMMELTKDQKEELTAQVEDTAKFLEERLALIEKERSSISEASAKLKDLEDVISEAKSEPEKQSVKKVQEALAKRYETYETLIVEYNNLAGLQEELYNMLINEDANVGIIQDQVAQVNKQNELVQQTVDQFNELTNTLNEVKQEAFAELQSE